MSTGVWALGPSGPNRLFRRQGPLPLNSPNHEVPGGDPHSLQFTELLGRTEPSVPGEPLSRCPEYLSPERPKACPLPVRPQSSSTALTSLRRAALTNPHTFSEVGLLPKVNLDQLRSAKPQLSWRSMRMNDCCFHCWRRGVTGYTANSKSLHHNFSSTLLYEATGGWFSIVCL